jgi:hypothetical protein
MRILVLKLTCLMCLIAGTGLAQGYPWCSTQDNVFTEVDSGILVLHHERATYNCCPDSFTFTVAISNDSLYVTEREVLTNPCSCLCCYNISTDIEGLSEGEWQVVYRWLDDDPWGWRDSHLAVTIGDRSQTGLTPFTHSEVSDCLDEPSGVPEGSNVPVSRTALLQNAPNPFNPQTTIAFELPNEQAVNLRVFDVSGHLVDVIIDNEIVAQGRNKVVWRGRDMEGCAAPAGVYFYRLEADSFSETKRMVLVK